MAGETKTAGHRATLLPGSYFGSTASSRTINGFALTESVYRPHDAVPTHDHERAFFYLVLDGSSCDTTRRETLSCTPGTLVYHPPEESHSNRWHADGGRCFHIEIPPERLELRGSASALHRSSHFDRGPQARLAQQLYREFRCQDAASALALEGLALELIASVHRGACATGGSRKHPHWLANAHDAARERCAEDLTVAKLAREAGVHPAHFARAFRAAYRCSVGEFVRCARVERACEQLRREGVSIARVANDLGFYDQSHFTRSFKRVVGLTPSQFIQRLTTR